MSKKALLKSCLILIVLIFLSIVNDAMGRTCSKKTAKDQVAFMVKQGVYKELKQEILQYKSDVKLNFPVQLNIVKGDWTRSEEVRATIKDLYTHKSISGVVLVGAIPMHRFYMHDFANPNPLFYEDFELKFIDKNNDGISDLYNGAPNLKVWVTNLLGVENPLDQGIEVLRVFFNKTHAYYSGTQNIDRRALAITGKDWPDGATWFSSVLGEPVFGAANVDILSSEQMTREALLDAFKNHTYTMFYIQVHSTYGRQDLETGSISSDEIAEITTGSLFTVNHGCSTGNWPKSNADKKKNTAMSWVFGKSVGQAVVCQVRTGMVYGHERMYERIMAGDYAGKAYLAAKNVAEQEMHRDYPDGTIVSGVTFIGNPFIYRQMK